MSSIARPRLIPLWIKLAYTAFMAVLIPVYLKNYGPTNFLYFCDVAAIMTLVAIWIESPMLLSACLVGIFLPQMLWVVDFFCELATWMGVGGEKGVHLTRMTSYMFKPPYFLRFLSFFHFWLPFLLVWLVWRVGYDKRGLLLWTVITWVLLTVCYAWMPPASPSLFPPASEEPLTVYWTYHEIRGKVAEVPRPQPNMFLVLLDEKGEKVAHTYTKADGSYLFEKVVAGKYRVQLRDPDIPVNIDYVYNIATDEEPQQWMDPDLYLALYMMALLAIFGVTHLLFWAVMPGPRKPVPV